MIDSYAEKNQSNIVLHLLGTILLVCMVINLYLIFQYAPEERSMGHIQRIFYFHVPTIWVSFLSFFVVFIFSIGYLWKRDRAYDFIAASAAEIGTVFSTFGLITGPLWGRPVWNTWWEWSPRLTLYLVLWFIYVAYLMLRKFVDDEEKGARLSAVFGIVGFINVPIVYASIRLWRDIHPSPVIAGGSGSGMHPDIALTFFFSLFTFTLFYFYILINRLRLEKATASVAEFKKEISYY